MLITDQFCLSSFFFFNDTATTEIYTLSLHDALPIYYSVNGAAPKQVTLTDSTARKFEQDARAAHTLFLEEMGLQPGDLVSYFATARDGAGNSASSDIYFLEIRPFGRDYKQAESGGGGGGGGGDSPEGLSARQRE